MLDFIFRRFVFKSTTDEQFYLYMFLKESILMLWIAKLFVFLFFALPISSFIAAITYSLKYYCSIIDIIIFIILILLSISFVIYFNIRFVEPIKRFVHNIATTLYFKKYIIKGKAISIEDFNKIKEKNYALYIFIKNIKCQGHCYSVSFTLLKLLKKGKIYFTSTKNFDDDEGLKNYEYTMHVFYVNNDWCFDTFSGNQYSFEEATKRHQAAIYASYSYEDIKDDNYDSFRKKELPALTKWCEENNCYENWLGDN